MNFLRITINIFFGALFAIGFFLGWSVFGLIIGRLLEFFGVIVHQTSDIIGAVFAFLGAVIGLIEGFRRAKNGPESPFYSSKMEGKRKHYDKDENLIGYSDRD